MRRTVKLSLAGALLALGLATPARAQAPYGYDSWIYNYPASVNYWYSSGYSGVYTDGSTASFAGNQAAPMRAVAPNATPPYADFGRSDGLAQYRPGATPTAAAPVATATAPRTVRVPQPQARATQRRGVFRRLRGR